MLNGQGGGRGIVVPCERSTLRWRFCDSAMARGRGHGKSVVSEPMAVIFAKFLVLKGIQACARISQQNHPLVFGAAWSSQLRKYDGTQGRKGVLQEARGFAHLGGFIGMRRAANPLRWSFPGSSKPAIAGILS